MRRIGPLHRGQTRISCANTRRRAIFKMTTEIEGEAKPAMVAEVVFHYYN